jgi:glutamine synthetase
MNTVRIVFADLNGVMKGKLIPSGQFAVDNVYGMPRSVLLQDISGAENYHIADYSPESGDPDMRLVPIESTRCPAPGKRELEQVVCDVTEMNGTAPLAESPRAVLERVVAQLHEQQLSAKVAIELEFFITNPDGSQLSREQLDQPYADVNALYKIEQLINDYLAGLTSIGLEAECVPSESGEGQLEINYRPLDPMAMADRTFMFKQMIREIALEHGLRATFLAKPFSASSGSGSHVHISLYSSDGSNILHDETRLGAFVAGQAQLARELYAIYAPNPNSYRRVALSHGYVPDHASHGHDDRKAALRIVGEGDNLRVENRIAGSDVNPYLQIAAALGAGILGLRNNASLTDHTASFPTSLPEALGLLEQSATARQLLGDSFVTAFVAVKQEEWQLFQSHISTWEREAYGPLV